MAALVEELQLVRDPQTFCRDQSSANYDAIYFVKSQFHRGWNPLTAEKTKFNPLEGPPQTSVCTAYLKFLYGTQPQFDKLKHINIYTGPGPSLYFFRAAPEGFEGIHDTELMDYMTSFWPSEDALKARPVARAFKNVGHEAVCSSFTLNFTPKEMAAFKNTYDPILKGLKNECTRLEKLNVVFDDGTAKDEEMHTRSNQFDFEAQGKSVV